MGKYGKGKQENDLRSRAEEVADEQKSINKDSSREMVSLHELQVHQIELELQNEELLRTQLDLETARSRFVHLFHNAPVGYVVLDASGIIKQSNATFASMIHTDYKLLLGRPFAQYLAVQDQTIFHGRFKTFFQNPENKRMELRLHQDNDSTRYVRLEAVPNNQIKTELFMTVSDINNEKMNELQLKLVNDILFSISKINALIGQEKISAVLIQKVCDVLAASPCFDKAWLLQLDEHAAVRGLGEAGFDEALTECFADRTWREFPVCMEEAFHKNEVIISRGVPGKDCGNCVLAKASEAATVLTTRLEHDGMVYGTLGLVINKDLVFADGLLLIEQLAKDMAFALHAIDREEERIAVQKELVESEQKVSLALEGAKLGLWDWDIASNTTTYNHRWATMLGYDLEEVYKIPEFWRTVLHPDDLSMVLTTTEAFLKGETPVLDREFRMQAKDGTWKWIISRAKIFERDNNGNPLRVVGTHIDNTEQRVIEMRMAEEKERLSVTLRSIGDGVITTDVDGKVAILNKVAEELTGWSQSEAAGKLLSEVFCIINEFTREVCENPGDKVLSTGEMYELSSHTLLISRDGTERLIADSGAPIKNMHGEMIGVVIVFRDITEKQRLQEHLQKSEKLDSLGILAGGIAHDFNNLLSGVFGYIEMAREESRDFQAVTQYLDLAGKVYNRAKDLTHQLLTFSKGGIPVRKIGNISGLIKNSTQFILTGSNVACEFDIPDSIAPCEYDENQMSQVIDNIVRNAQQAMPSGGMIRISLRNVTLKEKEIALLPHGDYIKICITDQGKGIPPELLGKIFDPFFSTKEMGSGLGLTTCYSIIQKHDGHIQVDSVAGKGSKFTIFLPASKQEVAEAEKKETSTLKGKGNILILDDEQFIRKIVKALLESAGYSVLEAETGESALELVKTAKAKGIAIQAAIFDLTIPGGMGGKEVTRLIREFDQDLVIIASSGYSDDPVIADPIAFGFQGSLQKPYSKQDLYNLLARIIQEDSNQ